MSPPMIAAIAALVTALIGVFGAVANYLRSASNVGLNYLERAMARMEAEIKSLIAENGRLEGQLHSCRQDSERKDQIIAGHESRIAKLEAQSAS